MLFSRKRNIVDLDVNISNTKIERKTESRFLGVIVDEKLNWSKHIHTLKSKMSKYIGVMCKLKFQIPLKARLLVYNSLVQSHLNFCSSIWGFAAKSNIDKLLTVQKKAIRSVMPGFVQYFYKDGITPAHTKPAFKEYNILTVQSLIAKNALLLMTKIIKFQSTLPKSICDIFKEFSIELEQISDIPNTWLDKYNTNNYRNSIFFKAPMLYLDYRSLNVDEIPQCETINPHKRFVKKVLLEYQSSGDTNEWESSNNILINISGPRSSKRNR